MNKNTLKNFAKQYGFYFAVGLVSIGAIIAVFLTNTPMQNQNENQSATLNTENEMSIEANSQETVLPTEDEDVESTANTEDETDVQENRNEQESQDVETSESENETIETTEVGEIVSETFSSTTAQSGEEPFFAEGDTLLLPVEGSIIADYTDDSTKHWYSEALEQTMRTYGIALASQDGESIKAPATGKILEIMDDSSTYDSTKYVGDVGELVIMDLGNGYTCQIGMQGGKAHSDLVGQMVMAGEEIGIAGSGTGPFADAQSSIYIQVQHDGVAINPTEMFVMND